MSAHINLHSADTLTLHIVTQSSLYPRLSPGKLHMLELVRLLGEEGFQWLDLTPGGDAYKDDFADHYDQVHSLTVFGSRRNHIVSRLKAGSESMARKALTAMHLKPAIIKQSCTRVMATAWHRLFTKSLCFAARRLSQKAVHNLYALQQIGRAHV